MLSAPIDCGRLEFAEPTANQICGADELEEVRLANSLLSECVGDEVVDVLFTSLILGGCCGFLFLKENDDIIGGALGSQISVEVGCVVQIVSERK